VSDEIRTVSFQDILAATLGSRGDTTRWRSFWSQVAVREGNGAVVLVTLTSYKEVGDRYGIPSLDLTAAVVRGVFENMTGYAALRLWGYRQAASYYDAGEMTALVSAERAARAIASRFPVTVTTREGWELPVRVECAVAERAVGEHFPEL
jgi:hypothetical protein